MSDWWATCDWWIRMVMVFCGGVKKRSTVIALLVAMSMGLVGCRAKFDYVFGKKQELVYDNDALHVFMNKNKIFTKGSENSVLLVRGKCSLPGNPRIVWNFGDGSEAVVVKNDEEVSYEYAYAKIYTITAVCENDLRTQAKQIRYVQVDYKDPYANKGTTPPNCEWYYDDATKSTRLKCPRSKK